MKLFKHNKNASTPNEAKTKETKTKETKPLGQMMKKDLFRIIWLTLYLFVIFLILYVLYSTLPVFFSYTYSSVGSLIGVNFASVSVADLIFWLMISLSVGLVFIGLLLMALRKLFGFLTYRMFVKHVLNKDTIKDSSKIISMSDKK